MQHFILKLILISIVVCVANYWLAGFRPDGWENIEFYSKHKTFLEQYQDGTNSLFFGSSRMLRHLDPVIFDSVNAIKGIPTNSYVLATNAAFFNEQCYLLDRFFADPASSSNLDYVFLELDDIITIYPEMLFSTQGSYYIQPDNLSRIIRQIRASKESTRRKIAQISSHVISMVRHHLYMGHGRQNLEMLSFSRSQKEHHPTLARKGYAPIDTTFPEFRMSLNWQERNALLMLDTMRIHTMFHKLDTLYSQPLPGDIHNPIVLERYLSFIRSMEERGVHVTCILPMRVSVSRELVSLYNALPERHRINMSGHPDITTLKATKYWFDNGHLNLQGSRTYSVLVADAFAEMMASEE